MDKEKDDVKELSIKFKEFKLEIKESILDLSRILSEKLEAQSAKLEIQSEKLDSKFEKLEDRIDRRLSTLKYWVIGGFSVFCIGFFYLFDQSKSYQDSRIERMENVFYAIMGDNFIEKTREGPPKRNKPKKVRPAKAK